MTVIISGTVKWFNPRKGYGFLTPTSDNAPTTADIFVHHSSLDDEQQRHGGLGEGWEVEFQVVQDDDGKLRATHVTGPGGAPLPKPKRQRHSSRRVQHHDDDDDDEKNGQEEEEEGETNGKHHQDNNKDQPSSPSTNRNHHHHLKSNKKWHDALEPDVQESLKSKHISTSLGTLDVAIDNHDVRVKLGTHGYASLVHARGIVAEGTFACTPQGQVTLEWARAIELQQQTDEEKEWVKRDETEDLIKEFHLTDEAVSAVDPDETAEKLLGANVPKPRDALEAHGFQMRQIVLHARPPRRGGSTSHHRRHGQRDKASTNPAE